MKTISKIIIFSWLVLLIGCKQEGSSMQLDSEVQVEHIVFDDLYEGVIDHQTATIVVAVPKDYNTTNMVVTGLSLSPGATATIKEGDVLNLSITQSIQVQNGDVFFEYTLSVSHDDARILSFKLNNTYTGVIDQNAKTIIVRVPSTEDVTRMIPSMTLSEGASVSPKAGETIDFTNPVKFTVTYNTAQVVYTVTVLVSDAPSVVYVGLANSIDGLNPEEKTAAEWLLTNVANAQYASFDDVRLKRIDLSKCKLIWWHLHIDGGIDNENKFDQAAPEAVSAAVVMKELYNNGMNFLLTRYGTYYAVKLGATLDNRVPNNCWGQVEETGEIVGGPWNFFMKDNTSHPIYQNLIMSSDTPDGVFTFDTGYRTTNSTAQWHIGSDWGGYPTLEDWREKTGAKDLGYGGDGAVVVWEFPTDGTKGGIVCIGSGCYDWYAHDVDTSADRYHANVATLTKNAIDYLTQE